MPDDPRETFAAWVDRAIEVLEGLAADRAPLDDLDRAVVARFLAAAGRVASPSAEERRALGRQKRREKYRDARDRDRQLLDRTEIRRLRTSPIFLTPRRQDPRGRSASLDPSVAAGAGPTLGELGESKVCYVCRAPYTAVHAFYDQLCPSCGDLNWAKRHQTADLRGRVALVTGGRVKIGFHIAVMLLRAGCTVIVTTRFPHDAAARFATEPDFAEWRDRVVVHGLDLRHTPSVEALCARLHRDLDRLDFIVNNACQTVRRPPGFYDHLLAGELGGAASDPQAAALVATDPAGPAPAAALATVPLLPEDLLRGNDLFPAGQLDADLQQIDLRKVNSWRLELAEVPTIELLEVHLVNAVAPFVLAARLKPLMLRHPSRDKHIVNVSAMEGQFYRTHKSTRHPHTNMAKAALNMLTRTSAADYVTAGIHMNSVDTGWVTDEDPADKAGEKRDMHDFSPPLDVVDGAARVCDPIFDGFNTGNHVWGLFLKDYKPTDW